MSDTPTPAESSATETTAPDATTALLAKLEELGGRVATLLAKLEDLGGRVNALEDLTVERLLAEWFTTGPNRTASEEQRKVALHAIFAAAQSTLAQFERQLAKVAAAGGALGYEQVLKTAIAGAQEHLKQIGHQLRLAMAGIADPRDVNSNPLAARAANALTPGAADPTKKIVL